MKNVVLQNEKLGFMFSTIKIVEYQRLSECGNVYMRNKRKPWKHLKLKTWHEGPLELSLKYILK